MYRKDAIRQIVREAAKRLPELRQKFAWADWRMALVATHVDHPEWFKNGVTWESLEPHLRDAGVDMFSPEMPCDFIMNIHPDE